jgi:hypothetical protein
MQGHVFASWAASAWRAQKQHRAVRRAALRMRGQVSVAAFAAWRANSVDQRRRRKVMDVNKPLAKAQWTCMSYVEIIWQ